MDKQVNLNKYRYNVKLKNAYREIRLNKSDDFPTFIIASNNDEKHIYDAQEYTVDIGSAFNFICGNCGFELKYCITAEDEDGYISDEELSCDMRRFHRCPCCGGVYRIIQLIN